MSKTVHSTIILTTGLAMAGLLLALFLRQAGVGDPTFGSGNVCYFLFTRYEVWFLAASLALLFSLGLKRPAVLFSAPASSLPGLSCRMRILLALTAALAASGIYLGATQGFPFSMDEYAMTYQADVFRQGMSAAPIGPDLAPFLKAATPIGTVSDPGKTVVMSAYLPVYSALMAAGDIIQCRALINPLMAALAVLLLTSLARRFAGPETGPVAALVAAVLLITSPQFLITSGSLYPLASHLALNLLWIWLLTHPARGWFLLVPLVSILATGLHQPHLHPLIAAPFVFRLFREKSWFKFLYAGGGVTLAALLAMAWFHIFRTNAGEETAALMGWPDALSLSNQAVQISLLVSWLNPLVLILPMAALLRWKSLPAIQQDLALGFLLLLLFHFFFLPNQGHGWGYRYVYPALGNLVLLATWQFIALYSGDERPALRGALLLTAAAGLVMLAFRTAEVRHVVSPFARADRLIAKINADYVVILDKKNWYAQDTVRNNFTVPVRPVRLHSVFLDETALTRLRQLGSVQILDPDLLAEWGLPRIQREKTRPDFHVPLPLNPSP